MELVRDNMEPGLRRLLEAEPRAGLERRIEITRTYNRIRQERFKLELKNARQGKSSAGMGSCLDIPEAIYRKYARAFQSWDYTPYIRPNWHQTKEYPASHFSLEGETQDHTLEWLRSTRPNAHIDQFDEGESWFDTGEGAISMEEIAAVSDEIRSKLDLDLQEVLDTYGVTYDPTKKGRQRFSSREAAEILGIPWTTFKRMLRKAQSQAKEAVNSSDAQNGPQPHNI